MTYDNRTASAVRGRGAPRTVDILPILIELVAVLKPHARGLRRWSVMKAMRDNRKRSSRDIPPKFEDDIERVFRRFCSNTPGRSSAANENAPFYRPLETAGEVWAMHLKRAEELLVDCGSNDLSFVGRSDQSRR